MTRVAFQLSGAGELIDAFENMDAKVIKRTLRNSVKETLPHLYQNIIFKVPADTGKLLSKMSTYGPKIRRKDGLVHGGVQTPTREELGIDPSDPHYYPAALEYGSKPHTIPAMVTKDGKRRPEIKHPGNRAFAFMRGGSEKTKPTFDRITGERVAKEVKKVERKLKRIHKSRARFEAALTGDVAKGKRISAKDLKGIL